MLLITEKKEKESAKEYVMRELVDNIVNVRLEPGQQLMDQELCEQFHVSRTPFREAALELAQRRLIEIRPKIGTYVSFIDANLVEEVRHLRSVLEAELAAMACSLLGERQIEQLWENIAVWQLYIKRGQVDKIFLLDTKFHEMLYQMCERMYWYELVEGIAPHFDRTTVLSFRCRPVKNILQDHEELVGAIEGRKPELARKISLRHMERYTENIDTIREAFPDYFKSG